MVTAVTCQFNNGGCEHMCTDMGNGTLCSCKDGYHLFGGQFCIGKLSHIIEHAANCTMYILTSLSQILMSVSLTMEDVPITVPIQ